MIMALPDFLIFLVTAVVSVYLPLFLQMMHYSATQIGFLLACYNAMGIVVPLLGMPFISKSKHLGLLLTLFGVAMALMTIPLYVFHTFWISAAFITLFAVFYKMTIPLCDSMINEALGQHRELYGRVRVFGSVGFVIMSLVMQYFIAERTCTPTEMILWTGVPSALFAVSVLVISNFHSGNIRSETISPAEQVSFANKNSVNNNATSLSTSDTQKENAQEEQLGFITTMKSFDKEFYLILFVVFMEYMGMVPSNNFMSLYVQNELHSNMSGFLWAFSAICEIPFMFLSSVFIRRFKPRPLILICTAAVALRMAAYAFIPNFSGAVIGQALHSVTFGLFYPAAVMYFAQSSKTKRALVISMSLLAAVSGIANVVGSSLGGWIIDTIGFKSLFCLFGVFPLVGLAVYGVTRKNSIHK